MKNTIFIIGSLNMDIVLSVEHLPSNGETILSKRVEKISGGKGANQAVAAARLGNKVYMMGKVGKDEFGKSICDSLSKDNINIDFVLIDTKKPTGTAYIMVDDAGNNSIIVDSGANMTITNDELEKASEIFQSSKIIIAQFETPIEIVLSAFKKAKKFGILTILNPAPAMKIPDELLLYTDIIIPNETEAEILTGVKMDSTKGAKEAGDKFLNKGCKFAVITLGSKGAIVVSKDEYKIIPAYKVNAIDTTAAGDSFIGAFATKLLEFVDVNFDSIVEAVKFGNLVSSIVVQKHGAQPSLPYMEEVMIYSREIELQRDGI